MNLKELLNNNWNILDLQHYVDLNELTKKELEKQIKELNLFYTVDLKLITFKEEKKAGKKDGK